MVRSSGITCPAAEACLTPQTRLTVINTSIAGSQIKQWWLL